MSTPEVAGNPAYWTVPVVRAALGLVPALVFTFNPDHTATFGLAVFGFWALLSGLVVGALGARFGTDRVGRAAWMLNGAITAIAGLLALLLPASLASFTVILIAWAAVTGLVELLVGLRGRGVDPASRDQVVVGALTMVYAILNLVLPADSATVVGYLGAYLVIIGVYLLIGGLSLRFGAADRRAGGAAPSGALPGTEQS